MVGLHSCVLHSSGNPARSELLVTSITNQTASSASSSVQCKMYFILSLRICIWYSYSKCDSEQRVLEHSVNSNVLNKRARHNVPVVWSRLDVLIQHVNCASHLVPGQKHIGLKNTLWKSLHLLPSRDLRPWHSRSRQRSMRCKKWASNGKAAPSTRAALCTAQVKYVVVSSIRLRVQPCIYGSCRYRISYVYLYHTIAIYYSYTRYK